MGLEFKLFQAISQKSLFGIIRNLFWKYPNMTHELKNERIYDTCIWVISMYLKKL